MGNLLRGGFAPRRWTLWPPDGIRVINWNIDGGLRLEAITAFLEKQRADILTLQEVDLNARRTGFRNIAEEIAKKLRLNYVFGYEFQELTQGRRGAPAYHGQATLSCWPIGASRVIRFHQQSNFWNPKWYLPRTEPFQQRLGGRIALVSQIDIGGRSLVTYNLHLESRGDKHLRIAQLSEAIADAKQFVDKRAVLLAGDLNVDLSRSYSSVVALHNVGFHSVMAIPARTTTPRGVLRHRKSIDWAYIAGLIESAGARVSEEAGASDHYPLVIDLKFTAK